jgi:hypothetical protein
VSLNEVEEVLTADNSDPVSNRNAQLWTCGGLKRQVAKESSNYGLSSQKYGKIF